MAISGARIIIKKEIHGWLFQALELKFGQIQVLKSEAYSLMNVINGIGFRIFPGRSGLGGGYEEDAENGGYQYEMKSLGNGIAGRHQFTGDGSYEGPG